MSLDQLKVLFTRVQGHTDLFQSVVTTTTADDEAQITTASRHVILDDKLLTAHLLPVGGSGQSARPR